MNGPMVPVELIGGPLDGRRVDLPPPVVESGWLQITVGRHTIHLYRVVAAAATGVKFVYDQSGKAFP